jgi:hypothetical protein
MIDHNHDVINKDSSFELFKIMKQWRSECYPTKKNVGLLLSILLLTK